MKMKTIQQINIILLDKNKINEKLIAMIIGVNKIIRKIIINNINKTTMNMVVNIIIMRSRMEIMILKRIITFKINTQISMEEIGRTRTVGI